MKLKFIGDYTNGRDSITICGVTFHGHDAAGVEDAEAIRRLSNHPEFEKVGGKAKAAAAAEE